MILSLLAGALPLALPAAAATAPSTTVPRATTTKLAFGTQFHGTWAELNDSDRAKILDTVAATGATWVRIDIGWSMIQPKARGSYDLGWGVPQVDKAVKMAHARGLKVVGTFWLTPDWAGGATSRRVLPTNPADYAAALKWAAARWTNEVQAWEVWNEPNAKEFLNPPDPVGYTNLLKAAYPAAKQGNPNAQVLIGGTMFVDTPWITRAYAAGAKNYFDVMNVHPYQGKADLPPDASDNNGAIIQRLTHVSTLVKLMAQNSDSGKPIWLTEFGWSTHTNTSSTPVWFLGVSEQVQAAYLKQSLNLIQQRYPQVTHAFWYTSRDLAVGGAYHQNNRGLIRRDFTVKPALREVTCYLRNCTPAPLPTAPPTTAPPTTAPSTPVPTTPRPNIAPNTAPTIVSLRARVNGRYVPAENAGRSALIANRAAVGLWETFDQIDAGNGYIALRAHANGRYVTAENAGRSPLIANRTAIGLWEKFQLIHNSDGTVSLRAAVNGRYVTAERAGRSPLIANRTAIGLWEKYSLVG